ncbi:MAG: hemerythrin domain-containing protein [Thermoanaerobaculia bacterium]|nr:hemerythrin domain-containing protein [Thermoanaerobaculia bacterium]
MIFLAELRAEHVLIDRVAASLRSYAAARARGEGDPSDGAAFRRFLRLWAGAWHHAREEETLFPALAEKAELALARGPLAAFVEQHRDMAAQIDAFDPLLDRAALTEEEGRRLVALATAYTAELGRHIDAENSVLIPESEVRLAQANVLELRGREPSPEELAARAEGERLAATWPAAPEPGVRGEGCVVCPSFGTTCRGVEAEWWNESEWEEFSDHLG